MAASIRSKRPNLEMAQSMKTEARGKQLTCAQRIEAATRRRQQVTMTEMMVQDAEAMFKAHDNEGTQLLSRGALTELMRDSIGLEKTMGDSFAATARLMFDAHSADSHFLSLPEFKHLYYVINTRYPGLLPRHPFLDIQVVSARGLPPADVNGKADPFVMFQIPGKPLSKSQTTHKDKTLDPVWRERFHDKYTYEEGDPIEFIVYDYDYGAKEFELIGKGKLLAAEFHKVGGFEGDIRLAVPPECPKGYTPTLKVKVMVNELQAPKKPEPAERAGTKSKEAKSGLERFKGAVQGVKAKNALMEVVDKDKDKEKDKEKDAEGDAAAPAAAAAPGAGE
mmetsp:Transcript_153141/g.278369  ORF Transcript_153141/g.278369 Transcript_153141/m.278369 type:complete len:336 (-) Transcript_153141:40-1047(-)